VCSFAGALESLGGKTLSRRSPAESPSGRAVAVTAIEHGDLIITVASLSRDPEPALLVCREDYFVTTILGGPLGGETWTDRTWTMMLRNHALAVSRVAEFVSKN
jgi:hypothetical protein